MVEARTVPGQETIINSVVVSPDGRRLLTVGWPNTIRLWDRETGQLIRAFDEGGKLTRSVAFSPEAIWPSPVAMIKLSGSGTSFRASTASSSGTWITL